MDTTVGFTVFDTAVGACAVSWGDVGLTGVWLPAETPEATRRAVLRRHPHAVEQPSPGDVSDAVDGITRLLAGDDVDLRDVTLDLRDVPDFVRRVYDVARSLPRGVT